MHLRSHITGTGSFVPPRIVPNKELEAQLHTTDAWIREKIGIEARRFVDKGVGTSDLALQAAKKALEAAELQSSDIDCILVATSTPDYQSPGVGTLLQHKLGCHKIPAFDIHNTSPGFIFALELGDQLIRAEKYQCVLVVGAEVHSTALDMTERGRMISVIFGDGAGAVILEPTEGNHGLLATRLHSDGTYFDKLWCEAPGSLFHPWITPQMIVEGKAAPAMDGRFIFEKAIHSMGLVCEEVLVEQNLTEADIAHVIPHQANLRIIETVAKNLKIPMKKVHTTIQKYGNTSSASIPITLDEAIRAGQIKKDELILMTSFGSGLSWGAGLVRW